MAFILFLFSHTETPSEIIWGLLLFGNLSPLVCKRALCCYVALLLYWRAPFLGLWISGPTLSVSSGY